MGPTRRRLRSLLRALRGSAGRVPARRKATAFGVTTAAVAGLMVLFVAVAFGASGPNAIGDPSAFEAADGNMTVEGSPALDWNCLTTPADLSGSTGTCGTNDGSYTHVQDLAAGTSADIGWTSGQKFDQACPALTNKNNSNKTTINDIASYNDTNTSSITNKIDTFLYGAVIRSTTTGNVSEDVELQQGTSGLCSGEPAGTTVYQRTAGDKLIAIDYVNGGTSAQFNVLTWTTTGACFGSATPPCWGNPQSLSANATEGQTNQSPILGAADGIQSGDVKSTNDPNGGSPALLPANAFAEFGIDLVAAGVVPPNTCTSFAQSLWESRSSGSSFTSNPNVIQIEPHSFSTCQPATINVVKLDASTGKGLPGAVFDLYAGNPATGSSLSTCTTNASGDCTLGPLTGTGTSTYTVKETTAPNGYSPGANQSCTITFSQTAQNPACTVTFNDSPLPGTINIQKNDSAGNPLKGAIFTLYTDNGSTVTGGDSTTVPDSDDTVAPAGDASSVTCTTNSAGACSFTNVTLGTYTVFETATPAGYQTAPAQIATIGLGSSPGTGQTVNLTFTDPYAPATIDVVKKDSSGNPLGGATFALYAGSSATGTSLSTCTTNSTGGCGLGNLNITQGSTFTIAETTAPNGYAGAQPQTFTVNWTNGAQTISTTFADTPVPGTINIHKHDSAGNPLKGAVFGLYTETGSESGDSATNPDGDDTAVTSSGSPVTCTTDVNGNCQFTNVPLGSYVVFETATPSGYQTAASQDVTIGLGSSPGTGDTESLTFTDPSAPATINVVKTDPLGVGLPGAVFQLYQGTTLLASCTTADGTNGTTLGGCSFGQFTGSGAVTYTVHEQTPPKGYSGSPDQTVTVTYTNTPQTVSVTFTDTPVPGTITIQKYDDSSPANALSGATFAVYSDTELGGLTDSATQPDSDDLAVPGATCTTNSSGSCSIPSIPPGAYTVFETTTPSGYQTAPAQDVTVGLGTTSGGGATVPLTFVDPLLHKVIVLVCNEGGTPNLDSSSVTFDGGTPESSLDTGTALPSGVTEAALCGLGGATKSDLADGAGPNAQITVH